MSEKKLIRANQMIYDEIRGRYRRVSVFLSSTLEDMERDLDDMICCFSFDHYDLSGRILNRAYDRKGMIVRDFSLLEDYRIPLIRAATYATVEGVEKLDHVEDFVFAEKEKPLSAEKRRSFPITTLRGERESLF